VVLLVTAALKKALHYGHRLFVNILKNQHACSLTGVKKEYGIQKRRDIGKLQLTAVCLKSYRIFTSEVPAQENKIYINICEQFLRYSPHVRLTSFLEIFICGQTQSL